MVLAPLFSVLIYQLVFISCISLKIGIIELEYRREFLFYQKIIDTVVLW